MFGANLVKKRLTKRPMAERHTQKHKTIKVGEEKRIVKSLDTKKTFYIPLSCRLVRLERLHTSQHLNYLYPTVQPTKVEHFFCAPVWSSFHRLWLKHSTRIEVCVLWTKHASVFFRGMTCHCKKFNCTGLSVACSLEEVVERISGHLNYYFRYYHECPT